MNNFSLIGKFQKIIKINNSNLLLVLQTSSPYHKKIDLSIHTIQESLVSKIKKDDLLGVKGFIDNDHGKINLIASKIIWLSNDKK